mmetsp:Transcript_17999/g.43256  ORF Transcript_17999/g.43256 Transcript_17999/m.43256 type:complete len:107 (+) Transcript_17999:39-359(+)
MILRAIGLSRACFFFFYAQCTVGGCVKSFEARACERREHFESVGDCFTQRFCRYLVYEKIIAHKNASYKYVCIPVWFMSITICHGAWIRFVFMPLLAGERKKLLFC